MPSSARKKKVAVDAWHGGEDSDARALPSPTETVFSLALHTRHRDLHSFPTRRSSDLDRRNHHLFQPLLYQVATGILAPGQVAPPLRHVLRRDKNVTVELRSEEHTSELQSPVHLVCRLLLEKKKSPWTRGTAARIRTRARCPARRRRSSLSRSTPATGIYTLSLHDALPISTGATITCSSRSSTRWRRASSLPDRSRRRSATCCGATRTSPSSSDRKSTRLNSSHPSISYAVFCSKKKSRRGRVARRRGFGRARAAQPDGDGLLSRAPHPPPGSTLFPYTTLFRSRPAQPSPVPAAPLPGGDGHPRSRTGRAAAPPRAAARQERHRRAQIGRAHV